MSRARQRLRAAVDIGGTFTDGVAVASPGGRIWVSKALTTPRDPGEAVSVVLADLLRQASLDVGRAGDALDEVVHGTTLVTNTLIERKGARTGLIATAGTKDVLSIGREVRYDLYDLNLEVPVPLVPDALRLEVAERTLASGDILVPVASEALRPLLDRVADLELEAVAIAFLHAYVNDANERAVRDALAARFPGLSISISSEVAREIREFERTSTTVCNAYVQPLVAKYLDQLETRIRDAAPGVSLRVMVSSGGFTSAAAAARHPISLLESGPAGGVLSAVNTGRGVGVEKVLAFDMGGTTAKACVAVDGQPLVAHSFECARVSRFKRGSGLPILTPSIDLIEIGAGGGSIAHVSALGLLNVGPESAGSEPGPACYDRGGTRATVTDADLVLGYIDPESFLGGTMPLRRDLAERALGALGSAVRLSAEEAARGICDIVNENMAAAARIHIAEKGHDPRQFTMVATGGAGPVHVVEVARKLRIPRVLVPIAAGAGSCLGLLAAPARVDRSWSSPTLLQDADWERVRGALEQMKDDGESELRLAGAATTGVKWWIGADMRYRGQGHHVPVRLPWQRVDADSAATFAARFESEYKRVFGQLVPGAACEVITWRLIGRSGTRHHRFQWATARDGARRRKRKTRPVYLPTRGAFADVPVVDRYALPTGARLEGPAILEERESTIVVACSARIEVLGDSTISITLKEFE